MSLRISWSSLRTHMECKQMGHLQRSGKKATLGNTRAFFAGTVTDRVVRDWLLNDAENNLGGMPDMVESIMEREKDLIDAGEGVMLWKDREDKAKVLKECIEAVTKIEPALIKHVLPYEYQPDFSFNAPLNLPHPDGGMEPVIINGFMDILVRNDKGEYGVWDVKHTRDDSYWRKTAGQLGFYDLAILLNFGAPTFVTGLLQPLCKEQVKPVPLSADSRSMMMLSVVNMATDVWKEDREPRVDNKLCGYCNVKHACTKFKPVMVNGRERIAF